jgi:hypothetical protein
MQERGTKQEAENKCEGDLKKEGICENLLYDEARFERDTGGEGGVGFYADKHLWHNVNNKAKESVKVRDEHSQLVEFFFLAPNEGQCCCCCCK